MKYKLKEKVHMDATKINEKWKCFKKHDNLLKYLEYHELIKNEEENKFVYLIEELLNPIEFIQSANISEISKEDWGYGLFYRVAVKSKEKELLFDFNKLLFFDKKPYTKVLIMDEYDKGSLYGNDIEPLKILMHTFFKKCL